MNTKEILNDLHRFCEAAIKYIALVLFALLTFLTTFFQSTIAFDMTETSTITLNGLKFFVLLAVGIVLICIVIKLLDHIPEKALFVVFTVLYIIMGVYLLTNINIIIRDDAEACYSNALAFLKGDYSNIIPGSYLYRNPYQLGLVVYESLLLRINQSHIVLYVANLIWVLLTNLFLWLSARLVYEDAPLTRKIIIFFSFAFLPVFFYFLFAYGTVPGLGCLMIALYLTIRTLKKQSRLSMIFSFVFIALACILKANFMIGGIALILIYLIKALKERRILYLVAMVGIICSVTIPNRVLISCYENITDASLRSGKPSSLYVAMGLQENVNDWCAFGWYNHFNDRVYNDTEYDPRLSSEIAMDAIQERVDIFLSDPLYAFEFFREKIITTWCEPTFQSIWSGPIISMGNSTENSILQNLYSSESIFFLFASAMNVLVVCFFLFSAIYVVRRLFREKESMNPLELFCMLYFIGGFLFHFVWETKCQYVYPYMLFLVPLCACGIRKITTIDIFRRME